MEFGTGFILLCICVVIFVFLTPIIIHRTKNLAKTLPGAFSNKVVKISPEKLSKKEKACL
ncbi:MAG: hypothetical protein LBT85_04350 [Bifidobacteriaceae bacterium]|jgi:predicted PurR-regulated permease PerM|nr:hypothetical protein [Bifidobacteriaceae bacterium]